MFVSIRSRVILLVLAALLPGMLGLAWLIQDIYAAERQANERTLRESSRALSLAIDSELLRRATIARVLSQSHWLDGPDPPTEANLREFEKQARRALEGLDGWIELSDGQRVLLNTRGPGPRLQDEPKSALTEKMVLQPLRFSAAEKGENAYAALVQPVQRDGRVKYNVAVMVLATEMQRIVDAQTHSAGWVRAVLDTQGTVVARHPGGGQFAGRPATEDLRALMKAKDEGLLMSVSLDGQSIAAFFSRAPMGWTYVIAMSREQFAGQLPGAVRRVALGALALLALSLAGALWLARRIVGPVTGLKEAAMQLQKGLPVTVRATGLKECDDVNAALGEAAETIRHSRADLERQVAEAVNRTRAAEQQASQGQRVAAVGRLTGGVAHDFNNLLGVISNSAHLIQRHPAAADLRAPLAATQRAVELGSQLTQHLLRFAGRQTLRPQRLALTQALPELRDMLASVLGRHVTVTVKVAPDTHAVHLDAGELELALFNLAMNARDAMPTGGELRISARNASHDEAGALQATHAGAYVLITVGDDGLGMEPEMAAHAFEPFFTTKTAGQGSGMGLRQVHGFCTQAGGSVELQSTLGLGTTVLMLLPAAEALPATQVLTAPATATAMATTPSTPARLAEQAAGQASIGGARVLLVEDNEALRDVTAALLMAHGAQVQCAADAAQALLCIEKGDIYDVVLSDIMMPGTMDGLALARRLRHLRPKLPVVLITAFSEAVLAAEHEFQVLPKPCPQDDLLGALHKAIASS